MNEASNFTHFNLIRTMKNVCNGYNAVLNAIFNPMGLSITQCEILNYLYHKQNGLVKTDELLHVFKISRASLSSVISALKEKNYIYYNTTTTDMRAKELTLTEKALLKKKIIQSKMKEFYKSLFSNIDDEELKAYQRTSQKLFNNLKNYYKEITK